MKKLPSHDQFERVCRALDRMKNSRRGDLVDHEDDVWCFFQNCWHLKDWIINDDQISRRYRNKVEADAKKYEALMICADLANRSKHLVLSGPVRRDAKVTKKNLTIHPGAPGTGYGEFDLVVTLKDGRDLDALDVATTAVENWRTLLKEYGIDTSRSP